MANQSWWVTWALGGNSGLRLPPWQTGLWGCGLQKACPTRDAGTLRRTPRTTHHAEGQQRAATKAARARPPGHHGGLGSGPATGRGAGPDGGSGTVNDADPGTGSAGASGGLSGMASGTGAGTKII